MFLENFLDALDMLPEGEREKACYEFCRFGITGVLPEDKNLAMFCAGASASVRKYSGRGGVRENAGRKSKESNADFDLSGNQNNQKNQKNQNNQNNQNNQKNQNNQNNQNNSKKEEKEKMPPHPQENKNNKKIPPLSQVTVPPQGDDVKTQPHFDLTPLNVVFERFGLPKVQKLTDDRRRKLKLRCEETGGYDEFIGQVEAALANSSFLRGDNRQGWRAGIDFFLQRSSWQKVLEGVYNDGNGSKMEKERHNFDWI